MAIPGIAGPMGILPGEHDWMERLMRGGVLGLPQSGGIFPTTTTQGGLFGRLANRFHEGITRMQTDPTAQFGLRMLANSGPSPVKRGLGEIFASSLLEQQQAGQQQEDTELRRRYMQAQIEAMQAPPKQPVPSSVAEYEYAKANGYPGTFQEWLAQGNAGPRETADIQNWRFFQNLTPEQQRQWIALQRQPTVPQLAIINGVPTLVDRLSGTTRPLSTPEAEATAAARKAEETAIGTARGEARGGLEKKGVNAEAVLDTLDLADPLIDVATGSAVGTAADKVAAFFGRSLTGDQAIAQLKILQANLMTNMPRMEGPQSDRDVQLYREAAGELGDPTVPRERKRKAITTIRALQRKYAARAGSSATAASPEIDALLNKYDPQ